MESIFKHYQDAVYTLDHPTLCVSPIANAITLAASLPPNARLHLVTHSRGGLVAEVLARLCGGLPLSERELGPFIAEQRKELKELAELVTRRHIRVDRIVRVACPARGTLLASKRLDAYLSIFKWTLEIAGVQVLPELIDFLAGVAQRREQAEELPGLEAQIPDSPLIQWLHAADDPVPGELRVVAGDIEGDSLTSWVKTLLADGFYWTDNDFIVQTRSMYGGPPREAGATFLLDQGGKASHTAYFAKDRAAGAIIRAILNDDPTGFRVVGPLSWSGESSSGDRAAIRATDGKPVTDKPAVFIVPGMLGSHLKANGQRIWLAPLSDGGLDRLKYDAIPQHTVEPDGLVGYQFDDLIAYLSLTQQAIVFPYDWRQPLEVEAVRLANAIEAAMDARSSSRQPVRILAYSSGALLARAVQLERPNVWERLMAIPGARMVMLGPPNGGTWTPMQVLSGDETFGGVLTGGASPFREADVRGAMGTFPGFLQLQAGLLDPRHSLDSRETWERLAQADLNGVLGLSSWHNQPLQRKAYRWGLPAQDALDRAVTLRKRLDHQASTDLGGFAKQLAIVVGCARFTPDSFENGPGGFVYLDTPRDGDGRVTWQSSRLPGVSAWTVDCDHGGLPAQKDAFKAYAELLDHGTTKRLPLAVAAGTNRDSINLKPATRKSRPSRALSATPPAESENDVFSVSTKPASRDGAEANPALHITVVNGDLMLVRQPLMLGHYRSMRLTGTEARDGCAHRQYDAALARDRPLPGSAGVKPDLCQRSHPW